MANGEKIEILASNAIQELQDLKKNIDANIESIIKFNTLAKGVEFKLKDAPASVADLNELVEEAVKNINNMTASSEALQAAEAKEVKTTAEVVALLKELNKLRKDVTKQKNAEAKEVKALSSDYAILNKAYNEQVERVRALYLTVGELSPVYKEAQKEALRMDEVLKKVDAAVGQHRRNVGNYNSALSSLGQIWRELPNAAFSFQTFVASLSNNLIPVIENFAQLQKENKALAAAGEQTSSVLGTIGESLLSVTSIAALAVTAFTILGPKIEEAFDQAGQEAKATEEMIKRLDALVTKLKKEVQDLFSDNTFSDTQDKNIAKSIQADERRLALAKARLASDKYLLDEEIKLNKRRIEENNSMIKAYEQREDDFVRFDSEIVVLKQKNADLENDSKIKSADFDRKQKEEQKKRDEEAQKEREKQAAKYKKLIKENTENLYKEVFKQTKFLQDFIDRQLSGGTPIAVLSGFNDDQIAMQAARNSEVLRQIQLDENNALIQLNEDYQAGTIRSKEQFEFTRTEITRKYIIARLEAEKKGIEAIQALLSNADKKQAQERISAINKAISDISNEAIDLEISSANAKREYLFAIYREIGNFAAQIGKNITENELGQLEERRRALDEDTKYRIDQIRATATSELDAEKKIASVELQAIVERNKIKDEEIKLKQRQAVFDKLSAIFQIGLNTAIGVSSASTNPLTIPLIPYIIGLGAAQLATVLAAPLPQYRYGTQDHVGGAFVAGEGGERELVIRPDGSGYVVPAKAAIYNEPAHTRVIPESQLTAMPMLSAALIGQLNKKQISTEKMEGYLQRNNVLLEKLIPRQRKEELRAYLPSEWRKT